MNEEEKKAIEMIKYLKENNSLIGFKPTNRDNLADTILNLIENQQKEINKLNDRCKNLDKEAQSYLEELAGDDTLNKRIIAEQQQEIDKLTAESTEWESKVYKLQDEIERNKKYLEYQCNCCKNNKKCKNNHWCITMDKIPFICDNFEHKNYISKDKVKEKIKEYEGLKIMDKSAYDEQVEPLKELLEENNK